jgi:hypothetical protein
MLASAILWLVLDSLRVSFVLCLWIVLDSLPSHWSAVQSSAVQPDFNDFI